MTLVLIPAGEFDMGAKEAEKDGQDAEMPQHHVRITKPFYLGKYEVTQREWERIMETTPWSEQPNTKDGDDYPATCISWFDVVEFCRKLSDKEGNTYRLPTEAEWEYACRGGTTTEYFFGDKPAQADDYSWIGAYDNGSAKGELYAQLVGTKRANPFGLYDMTGNVWEWCSDWFDPKYYAKSPVANPEGPSKGVSRVNRGGCWVLKSSGARSAFRYGYEPKNKTPLLGFRVVQNVSK